MKTTRKLEDIFIKNLPTIDLHGYDRDSARVATNDFIDEAYVMGWNQIVIVHGIGSGVIRGTVQDTLAKNKKVLNYHVYSGNIGCTIVEINKKEG